MIKRMMTFGVIGVLALLLDQVTKELALAHLTGWSYEHLVGPLGLQLHFNPGAALSFLTNATWIFTGISTVAVIGIVVYARKVTSWLWLVTLAVVWGGAAGNLVDRLTRDPGFPNGNVVDFIVYGNWFIGNVADIWLVVGIALLGIYGAIGIPVSKATQADVDEGSGVVGREGTGA